MLPLWLYYVHFWGLRRQKSDWGLWAYVRKTRNQHRRQTTVENSFGIMKLRRRMLALLWLFSFLKCVLCFIYNFGIQMKIWCILSGLNWKRIIVLIHLWLFLRYFILITTKLLKICSYVSSYFFIYRNLYVYILKMFIHSALGDESIYNLREISI